MTGRVAHRFKSSDKRGFFKANSTNDNDTTNLSSNGKMDATLDLAFTGKGDQMIFDKNRDNRSFNMD